MQRFVRGSAVRYGLAIGIFSTQLSGCMLPLIPVVGSLAAGATTAPASTPYRSPASKAVTYNAAYKALAAKGSVERGDRETGIIEASRVGALSADIYMITVNVDEETAISSRIRVSVRFAGGYKLNVAKGSQDILEEIVVAIENELQAKLEKV